MHVLLVESDLWLREMYQHAFLRRNVAVTTSSGAQSCLEILSIDTIDALVINLGLPLHNGIEVLHEMQSYSDWQSVPVIALSARSKALFKVDNKTWRAHGVRDFVYMPDCTPDELVSRTLLAIR